MLYLTLLNCITLLSGKYKHLKILFCFWHSFCWDRMEALVFTPLLKETKTQKTHFNPVTQIVNRLFLYVSFVSFILHVLKKSGIHLKMHTQNI